MIDYPRENQNSIRSQTDDDMTSEGWAAWSRDASGLLCTSHAPFENIGEWMEYVNQETLRGNRIYYPGGKMKWEVKHD